MVFPGEDVNLRPVRQSDLPKFVEWSNDREIDCFMDGGFPMTDEESLNWFEQLRKDRHVRKFSIETKDGSLIGEVALDQIAWRSGDAELIIRIGEKSLWGKGLGTDAVKTVLDIAFEKLALKRIYLRVYSFNTRAIRCYEKCGFRKEGVLKRSTREDSPFKEIILMRKLKEEHLRPIEQLEHVS